MTMETETIRWTYGDSSKKRLELEARLTDETLVTVTYNLVTEVHTTRVDINGDRYVPGPLGHRRFLYHCNSWEAVVLVENPVPAWLAECVDGDILLDRDGTSWQLCHEDWASTKSSALLATQYLFEKYGPLTPLLVKGKPVLSWEDADASAIHYGKCSFYEGCPGEWLRGNSSAYAYRLDVLRKRYTLIDAEGVIR